jgi:hypothetical protein
MKMSNNKEPLETLGLKLPKDSIRKFKKVAIDLDSTASDLAREALSLWWQQSPEAQKYGALFEVGATQGAKKEAEKPAKRAKG